MLEQQAKWATRTQTSHSSVITGSIVGIDGQPVAGACVTAVTATGSTSVAAAPDGSFRLAGLAAGSYALEYRDCGAAGRYLPDWSGGAGSQSSAARYQVGIGQVRSVPVTTLKPTNPAAAIATDQSSFERTLAANSRSVTAAAAAKTGEISGTVTGKGKPLSGICIEVVPVYRGKEYGAKTGKNGIYTVRHVAPGSYHVIFAPDFACSSHANWLQQVYKNNNNLNAAFGGGTAVHARAGHITSGIDAQLRLGGEITGTVTNKSGAKVRDICVYADGKVGHNQYQFSGTKTSATGGYQLHALFPGRYTVQFGLGCGSHGNYAPATHSGVKVGLGKDVTVNQVLPTGATISGEVTLSSSSGSPIEGICVYAYPVRGTASGYGSGSTNSNGDYRVTGLSGGDYQLYFRPGCKNYGNYVATSVTAVTTAGEPTTGVNAVLQVGGIISGTVTDTHGNPVADMCIELTGTGNYTALVPYRTKADGSYTIDQLSAGTYQVGFFSGCGNSASFAPNWYDNQPSEDTATPIAIATGATFTANAVLQPGATITGRVTNASGHRLSNICVDATATAIPRRVFRAIRGAYPDAQRQLHTVRPRTGQLPDQLRLRVRRTIPRSVVPRRRDGRTCPSGFGRAGHDIGDQRGAAVYRHHDRQSDEQRRPSALECLRSRREHQGHYSRAPRSRPPRPVRDWGIRRYHAEWRLQADGLGRRALPRVLRRLLLPGAVCNPVVPGRVVDGISDRGHDTLGQDDLRHQRPTGPWRNDLRPRDKCQRQVAGQHLRDGR